MIKEQIIKRINIIGTKKELINEIADYIQDTVTWLVVLKINKKWGYMIFDFLEEENIEVRNCLDNIDTLNVVMQGYEMGNTSKLSIARHITYFRNIYKEDLIEKEEENKNNSKNNRIDKDKFIEVKKFKTALKQLHKLIHKNKLDDEIFNYDEMLMFYEEGLKEFYKLLEKKQSIYETRNELINNKELCYSTPWEFHYSWKYEDELTNDISFFRINICNDGEHWNYIDCGYTVE